MNLRYFRKKDEYQGLDNVFEALYSAHNTGQYGGDSNGIWCDWFVSNLDNTPSDIVKWVEEHTYKGCVNLINENNNTIIPKTIMQLESE